MNFRTKLDKREEDKRHISTAKCVSMQLEQMKQSQNRMKWV